MDIIELHQRIVTLIWEYCKEHWQTAETAIFTMDVLNESIKYNDKGSSTDSSLLIKDTEDRIIVESI